MQCGSCMTQVVLDDDVAAVTALRGVPTTSLATEQCRGESLQGDWEVRVPHAEDAYWEAQYARVAAELQKRTAEAQQLGAKVQRLEQELRDAQRNAHYWEAQHKRAIRRMEELKDDLKAQLQQAQAQIRELRQRAFGRKSERGPRRDSRNVPGEEEKPKRNRGGQPGHKPPGRRDYSNLPKDEEYIDVPEGQKICSRCGKPLFPMTDTIDSQQIEIEVRAYRRVLHRRRYRRTCTCPGQQTISAPAPPKLIPKGLYGTSVWVAILLDKFESYRSTARLLGDWEHVGLSLSASTVTHGLWHLERPLGFVHQAMAKHNAHGDLHGADESRWPVFFPSQGKKAKPRRRWWLWAFSSPDSVVFRIDSRHSHQVAEEHFASSPPGTLVVDRAAIYGAMKQVKAGKLRLAFCWVHVRRDFVQVARNWPKLKPRALEWLKRIHELYRINRRRRKCEAGSAEFQRQQQALEAAIESFRAEFTKALEDPKLHPACRKVMKSLRKHWPGLVLFVQDPRIPMDNNERERVIRGPVLGRKNYYGSGAPWAACLAAEMFSILATLKLWRINPRAWLQWYLESYAAAGRPRAFDPEPFLPWNLSEERLAELRDERPPPTPAADAFNNGSNVEFAESSVAKRGRAAVPVCGRRRRHGGHSTSATTRA